MYTDHQIAMLTNLILCTLPITFKKLHENISQEWNQRIENSKSNQLSSVQIQFTNTLNSQIEADLLQNTITIIITNNFHLNRCI